MLEGVHLRRVDEREMLSELALNIRIAMYKEKLKAKDLFDKQKEELRIIRAIRYGETHSSGMPSDFAKRLERVNKYFKKKHEVKE